MRVRLYVTLDDGTEINVSDNKHFSGNPAFTSSVLTPVIMDLESRVARAVVGLYGAQKGNITSGNVND